MKLIELLNHIYSKTREITQLYQKNASERFSKFIKFVRFFEPTLDQMLGMQKNPILIGKISPRLLQDPLSSENLNKKRSQDEEETYVMGYLSSILKLLYYSVFRLKVWDYNEIKFEEKINQGEYTRNIEFVNNLLDLILSEIKTSDLDLYSDVRTLFKVSKDKDEKLQGNNSFLSEETSKSEGRDEMISFTSRLISYHRAVETKSEDPLIIDPFAEKLTGDLEKYRNEHRFTLKRRDYSIVRAYYIENNLLKKWCMEHNESQILMLGAGLDTRAYRLEYLKKGNHRIFEVDYDNIISYKKDIMKVHIPYSQVNYICTDVLDKNLIKQLKEKNFNPKVMSFWILEGLAYYLEKDSFKNLLKSISAVSKIKSEIFIDICVPAIAELNFGAFTSHFKWGLKLCQIPDFFSDLDWNVSANYADNFDEGRDVGQKGMIFIHAIKN